MTDPDLLRRAAERVGQDHLFLASVLLTYARAEGLDDDGLAGRLGCAPEDLSRLRLCGRPRREAKEFRMDVHRIAERFGLDPARLAEVVRLADALDAFRRVGRATDSGLLAAARDRDDAGSDSAARIERQPADQNPDEDAT